jgi:hypothetical protein
MKAMHLSGMQITVFQVNRDVIIYPAVQAVSSRYEGCPVTVGDLLMTRFHIGPSTTASHHLNSPSVTLENFTLNDITFDIGW